MRTSTRKVVAALAAATGLAVWSAPAAAAPVTFDVTSGTVQVPNLTFVVNDPAPPANPCEEAPDPTPTLDLDVTGGASPYTATVTGLTFRRLYVQVTGVWVQLTITRDAGGDNVGTLTTNGAPPPDLTADLDLALTIRVDVLGTDPEPPCENLLGDPECILGTQLDLDGDVDGAVPLAPGDEITDVDGGGTLVVDTDFFCLGAIDTLYDGQPTTWTDLVLEL